MSFTQMGHSSALYRKVEGALVFILLIFVLTGCGTAGLKQKKSMPTAVDGIIDLTDWDFSKEGPVRLAGRWEFYWQQLLEPGDFESSNVHKKTLIQVPGPWTKYGASGVKLPHEGYATYRLIIKSKDISNNLAIKYKWIESSCRIWVNKKQVLSMGEVAVNSKCGQIKPRIVPISLNNQYNEIIVQVSNYGYDEGGFIVSLLLGETMQLVNLREKNAFRDIFVFGSILIMGLYHFTWFITIREDKSTLFFGFICILISIRVLLMGEMLLYSFLPNTCLCRKLSTFTLSMGLFFMGMFIHSLFPDETHLRFVRFVQAISGLYSIIVLITPEIISILFYSVYEFIALSVVVYLTAAVVRAVYHKRTGAILVLSAFGILFAACINDLLTQLGIFRTGYYIPQGFTLFIYVQAFMLADKFRKMIANEEKLLKSELRTLQAQIKPHFLFNVLNTIIHMCRVSPEKALNLLTQLNIYLQCSFSFKNDEEYISLKQEIKHVTSYLEIEKARFRERLQVEFDIQEEIECNIPPLILQPIVENAVKHGLLPQLDGGNVKITTKILNNVILLVVEDNGVGMPEEKIISILQGEDKSAGIGVANVNRRLNKLYGEGLHIESRPGHGTTVTIKIPMQ